MLDQELLRVFLETFPTEKTNLASIVVTVVLFHSGKGHFRAQDWMYVLSEWIYCLERQLTASSVPLAETCRPLCAFSIPSTRCWCWPKAVGIALLLGVGPVMLPLQLQRLTVFFQGLLMFALFRKDICNLLRQRRHCCNAFLQLFLDLQARVESL